MVPLATIEVSTRFFGFFFALFGYEVEEDVFYA